MFYIETMYTALVSKHALLTGMTRLRATHFYERSFLRVPIFNIIFNIIIPKNARKPTGNTKDASPLWAALRAARRGFAGFSIDFPSVFLRVWYYYIEYKLFVLTF